MNNRKARFHLPGLFESYDFYRAFLPLYAAHRDWFYGWAEIASLYGAPGDCLWGGGRVELGDAKAADVLALTEEFGLEARLTFSNSLLKQEHLTDRNCRRLCALFETGNNGIIVHSDLLLHFLRDNYPGYYFISSTTKVLTAFSELEAELNRKEFSYVVPDFRLNHCLDALRTLPQSLKDKTEFLCNECCWVGCRERKECYEAVSRKVLGLNDDFVCHSPGGTEGYRFSKAMDSPAFLSCSDIRDTYLPLGFSQFKIEGRGLGTAVLLEFLLYYLVKPEYHIHIREALYLDSSLDLF